MKLDFRTHDPMERLVEQALTQAGILHVVERDMLCEQRRSRALDFFLPDYDVYIEVKRFHSARIASQMALAPNVIALQGEAAVRLFCEAVGTGAFARKDPR